MHPMHPMHPCTCTPCTPCTPCTQVGEGVVTCELPVTTGLTNAYGTLHGGATATLVDIVGTMALLTQNPNAPGVSVELSTSYLSAVKEGDVVVAEGKVTKSGSKLGFTQVCVVCVCVLCVCVVCVW
jgi:acyl-coenzyme A thioesterase 13